MAYKFKEALRTIENCGPTAKLWVQYFRMVILIKQFIEAEWSGNWDIHLTTVQKMLPFFHAAGHFFYAKCAHLYLQDILTLKDRMFSLDGLWEWHIFKTYVPRSKITVAVHLLALNNMLI